MLGIGGSGVRLEGGIVVQSGEPNTSLLSTAEGEVYVDSPAHIWAYVSTHKLLNY